MSVLADTNVLLRIAQLTSPERETARSAVVSLVAAGVRLCVVPQVIYEFWVAATRPVEVNGLGMDIPAAEVSISEILDDYELRRDERGIFAHWQHLVASHSIRGKGAHDARLVAAMLRHGLSNILTFNKADFIRFQGIAVFTPADILCGMLPS